MSKYIDIHCHIKDISSKDTEQYLSSGIVGAICNATAEDEWAQIISASNLTKNFFSGAIGIHPWNIQAAKPNWEERLIQKLQESTKLMVGEIGLDKTKDNFDFQIEYFISQLRIAHILSRGAHIHCVGAWDKMLYILKENKKQNPPFIVFHSYTGGAELIKQLQDKYNAYFSYSPRTIKNISKKAYESILMTPADRLLLESDSDKITDVIQTATQICEIKKEDKEKLIDTIYKNSIIIKNNGQTK